MPSRRDSIFWASFLGKNDHTATDRLMVKKNPARNRVQPSQSVGSLMPEPYVNRPVPATPARTTMPPFLVSPNLSQSLTSSSSRNNRSSRSVMEHSFQLERRCRRICIITEEPPCSARPPAAPRQQWPSDPRQRRDSF